MDTARILSIKRRLVETPDAYVEVSREFFERLGTDHDLANREVETTHQELSQLLGELIHDQIGVQVAPRRFRGIPEWNLLHGGFRVGRFGASVFFFDDLGVGVVSILEQGRRGTQVIRFEACRTPGSTQD